MNDPRYSELLFLSELAKGSMDVFQPDGIRSKAIGLSPTMHIEMAAALVEDLYVRFDREDIQLVVAKLRGELASNLKLGQFHDFESDNPRHTLHNLLSGFHNQGLQRLRITFRGLRRIEELRDLLKRDRILEPFGILLDKRYFLPDLNEALLRAPDVPVSVINADMDNFKIINTKFGHAGGDVVMIAYLEAVRDSLGLLGTAYRGLGDEAVCLIIGQEPKRAEEIAQTIRQKVGALDCNYKGQKLPKVTASIGVASTPPNARSADIETIADARNQKAKDTGKNQVVAD